jgi:hypothetical protein
MVLIPEFSVTPVVKGKDAVRFLERMKNPKPLSAERRAELARVRELLDRQLWASKRKGENG